MALEPQLVELGARLMEVGLRNTVAAVSGRIAAVKAKKQDAETINALIEIINELQADKNATVEIAQQYDEILRAQRISSADVEYITDRLLPIVTKLAILGGQSDVDEVADQFRTVFSVETITILQLLGFTLRRRSASRLLPSSPNSSRPRRQFSRT